MARGHARIVITGNLGADPDMRYLPNGDPVTNFSVAVNRKRRGSDGNMQDETDWYRVACFRKQAEIAAEYLKKGMPVLVDGTQSIRKFTGNDGVERTSVEINCDQFIMTGSKDDQPSQRETADEFEEVPF